MATIVGKIAEVAGLDKCSKGHDGYEHQGYGYSCSTCGQRLYRWVPGTTRVNLIGAAPVIMIEKVKDGTTLAIFDLEKKETAEALWKKINNFLSTRGLKVLNHQGWKFLAENNKLA